MARFLLLVNRTAERRSQPGKLSNDLVGVVELAAAATAAEEEAWGPRRAAATRLPIFALGREIRLSLSHFARPKLEPEPARDHP